MGVTVLAAGMLGFAPTPANAATTQTITGSVGFAANTSLKLSDGGIGVFDGKCNWIDAKSVTWKGNAYTAKIAKTGTVRVVYSNWAKRTSKSPYGLTSAPCAKAKSVYVGAGKKVKINLAANANGLVHLTTSKTDRSETYFWLYDAKTYQLGSSIGMGVKGFYRQPVAPGAYKVAKVRWSASKKAFVPIQVLGTAGTRLSKGKTVTVTAAKPISVNFERGAVTKAKDFSYAAKVSVSGSAKVGQTLSVKRSSLPAGTSLSYVWERWNGAGPDGKVSSASSYRLTSKDLGAYVSVRVIARKSGYLPQDLYAGKSVPPGKLTVSAPYSVSGLTDGELTVGAEAAFTAPRFAQGAVGVTYDWVDDEGRTVSSSASYTPSEEYAGRDIALNVTYYKRGYGAESDLVELHVAADELVEATPLSVGNASWDPDAERYGAPVGATVVITPAVFDQDDVEVAYEWISDTRGVVSESGSYELTEDDADSTITVLVTYAKPGYGTVEQQVVLSVAPLPE